MYEALLKCPPEAKAWQSRVPTPVQIFIQDCSFFCLKVLYGLTRAHALCCDYAVSSSGAWACADEDIREAKTGLVGAIMQQPPMYSAVSIRGERLYKAARRGNLFTE